MHFQHRLPRLHVRLATFFAGFVISTSLPLTASANVLPLQDTGATSSGQSSALPICRYPAHHNTFSPCLVQLNPQPLPPGGGD